MTTKKEKKPYVKPSKHMLGVFRKHGREMRAGLIAEYSPTGTAEGLAASQALLIDRIISSVEIVDRIEDRMRHDGTKDAPRAHLAYSNAIKNGLKRLEDVRKRMPKTVGRSELQDHINRKYRKAK